MPDILVVEDDENLNRGIKFLKTGEISIGIYGGRPVWKRFIEVVLNLRIMTIF